MTPSQDPAPIQVRTTKPPGVLPKNLQSWVTGGLALAMVVVIAFSSRTAPKSATPLVQPDTKALEPNDGRIQEYRARMEQEARRLADEQARLAHAKQSLAGSMSRDGAGPALPHETSLPSDPYTTQRPAPERSWIEIDREKRAYESMYASNVALTKRPMQPVAPAATSIADGSALVATPSPSRGPSEPAAQTYRIPEGTVIETVLTNRLDSSFSGPVNALVTTNVYSADRMKLLIPQGTRVLGSVKKIDTFGEQRLAVTFDRLILPNGEAVALPSVPGLSQLGETGLLDQVNHHYGQVFGVALAVGAIAGLSQAGTRYGADAAASDVYRQGMSSSLSQTSLHILDRYLNVVPTFTVREGTRVKAYLTADLDLPAYSERSNEKSKGDSQ